MSADQLELISALKNQEAYSHKVSRIAIEETHISWVFLTGPFAYKIKKELKFGEILDFSTLSLRRKFCQKEVEINRVLCGDMYKGVVKIVKQGDDTKIVGVKNKGRAIEYAVKMIELPQNGRMDNLLLSNKVSLKTIEALTVILAEFHRTTPTNNRIKKFGTPEFMQRKIDENFETLFELADIDPKFENKLGSFIKNNSKLFYERIEQDKVRDIHGDLYLSNIFIANGRFYLYDRIEFNDSLRYADVAEDVAHFAMDLDFHRRPDFRRHFISQYMDKSKDVHLEVLIYFLMCYKACVRVKVSLFRAKSVSDEKKKAHMAEAKSLLNLAESYLELL